MMAAPTASNPVGDAKWAGMDTILENIQIVPENTLVQISKGPLLKFTQECKSDQ
jgi:hypothetical protein